MSDDNTDADGLDLDLVLDGVHLTNREAFALLEGLRMSKQLVNQIQPLHDQLSDEFGIKDGDDPICICGLWTSVIEKLTIAREMALVKEKQGGSLIPDTVPKDFK